MNSFMAIHYVQTLISLKLTLYWIQSLHLYIAKQRKFWDFFIPNDMYVTHKKTINVCLFVIKNSLPKNPGDGDIPK